MTSHDGKEAIVVESSKLGTIISGNHQHVLHGNLGTTSGGRIIFSFYLAQALLDRAPNRFAAGADMTTDVMCVCHHGRRNQYRPSGEVRSYGVR